ncbi:MAG: hypothetical protein ACXU7D_04510 [Burkholderiaceae bacterium]
MRERPISFVPKTALVLLAVGFALQIGWHVSMRPANAKAEDLPPPPSLSSLNIASFGEQIALAKVLMLYVQSFDSQSGLDIPFRHLNYERLQAWLSRVLELDPPAQYPLFAASRIYADGVSETKQRLMFNFIYQQFFTDPDHRWPSLAYASVMAKHRLKDLPLARTYAQAIRLKATGKDVPNWAKEMEIFLLQDMNELESAKVLIGGLLNSGQITDPHEVRFLQEKLTSMEQQAKSR